MLPKQGFSPRRGRCDVAAAHKASSPGGGAAARRRKARPLRLDDEGGPPAPHPPDPGPEARRLSCCLRLAASPQTTSLRRPCSVNACGERRLGTGHPTRTVPVSSSTRVLTPALQRRLIDPFLMLADAFAGDRADVYPRRLPGPSPPRLQGQAMTYADRRPACCIATAPATRACWSKRRRAVDDCRPRRDSTPEIRSRKRADGRLPAYKPPAQDDERHDATAAGNPPRFTTSAAGVEATRDAGET